MCHKKKSLEVWFNTLVVDLHQWDHHDLSNTNVNEVIRFVKVPSRGCDGAAQWQTVNCSYTTRVLAERCIVGQAREDAVMSQTQTEQPLTSAADRRRLSPERRRLHDALTVCSALMCLFTNGSTMFCPQPVAPWCLFFGYCLCLCFYFVIWTPFRRRSLFAFLTLLPSCLWTDYLLAFYINPW